MEVAGFYWRGGTVPYEFADTTIISFVFRKEGGILQRSPYIPLGHLSSKAGVIFCSLLFLVPGAAKSKIVEFMLGGLDIPGDNNNMRRHGRDIFDLYRDYLLVNTQKAMASGLSELADTAISHEQITRFLA
jgi:hypothetical protein